MSDVARRLRSIFDNSVDVPQKLRALWALYVIGRLDQQHRIELLQHSNESIQAWGVRLLGEDRHLPQAATDKIVALVNEGTSPLVRLHVASILQRLPSEQRIPIARSLLRRAEDSTDANLPLMIWYAIEPLIADDQVEFTETALRKTETPIIAKFIGRRVASIANSGRRLESLVTTMRMMSADAQSELLSGITDGLAGQRRVAMPQGWKETFPSLQKSQNSAVLERSLQLALIFDDPIALAALERVAVDRVAEPMKRNRAISALVAKRSGDVSPLLLSLLDDPAVRRATIRGLAEFENSSTPIRLLKEYPEYDAATRQDALQTLASRLAWAVKLMDGVESNLIPRSDLTAYTARQLYNLGDESLNRRMKAVWGDLRTTPAAKAKLIASFKTRLTPESLQKADRSSGRALFQKTCASCHRLFDSGGKIGPDITGSQRTNLDYLLQTLVDPSAAVAKEYQTEIIETSAGRVITGFVVDESQVAVTIQTVNEQVIIPLSEIEQRSVSSASMMPEGMLQTLKIAQVRDLIAYLMGNGQVPLPDPSH